MRSCNSEVTYQISVVNSKLFLPIPRHGVPLFAYLRVNNKCERKYVKLNETRKKKKFHRRSETSVPQLYAQSISPKMLMYARSTGESLPPLTLL